MGRATFGCVHSSYLTLEMNYFVVWVHEFETFLLHEVIIVKDLILGICIQEFGFKEEVEGERKMKKYSMTILFISILKYHTVYRCFW